MRILTILVLGLTLLLFKPEIGSAQASDTLDIGAADALNISTIINSDTTTGGVIKNPNRVYRLERGVIYALDAIITVRGSFKMIAAAGSTRPPVLSAKILADNSSIARYVQLYGALSKVEFHDIYFLGLRNDKAISNALNSGISILDSAISLTVRRCVFDGFGARGIQVFEGGVWSKIDVQDSKFRNLIYPGGSWLYGQAFKTTGNTYPLDTVKFINNTFLACGSYIFGVSGYVNYALFDHNTILYGIGNTFLSAYNTNVFIKNNIVYSGFVAAGYKPAVYGDWFYPRPDTVSSALMVISIPDTVAFRDTTLITKGLSYITNTAHGIDATYTNDAQRVLSVSNNAYYYPTALTNFINAYNDTVTYRLNVTFPGGSESMLNTVAQPRWLNDYTQSILATEVPLKSPMVHIDAASTYNQDPQFNDVDAVNHIDSVIVKLTEILTDKITTWRWTYKLTFPPTWPLPEDLAYSNATLLTASQGGFPLGDLNWFPTQKAAWESWRTTVGVDDAQNTLPEDFELLQNYPNPFNPATVVKFKLPEAGSVSLKVYDVLGREVLSLLDNREMNAGSHTVVLNASSLSGGVYFYTLRAGDFTQTRKMVLLK